MQKIITIDGRVVYLTLDTEGRILSAYSPFYTDQLGNPYQISFGYGAFTDDLEAFIRASIALLGLAPTP